jgi:hypothetical protein
MFGMKKPGSFGPPRPDRPLAAEIVVSGSDQGY